MKVGRENLLLKKITRVIKKSKLLMLHTNVMVHRCTTLESGPEMGRQKIASFID